MRAGVRALLVLVCLIAGHSVAWAQATIAGAVRDSSGAVLPGVTVEAASPVLIEKVRAAVSDGNGRYRIEDLRPGTYSVTFTLPGFATVKQEGIIVSGTAVTNVNGEMRVGGVQETITVTGETPVVDVSSTRREITLDNETIRALPSTRSYSYLINTVPGLQTNNNNVNTGPVFAIFPIDGGRGVESRLTVDGLNISNPPGGNQPSNYVADVGNASEVTMTTSGGLGENETAGLTVNIVPRQGGNSMSGMLFYSGFSKGMQSSNYDPELASRGVLQPNPVYHVYDFNTRSRWADRQGQTLVRHERPLAGAATEHAEPVSQSERRQSGRVDLGAVITTIRRSRIARGRTTHPALRGRHRSEADLRSSGMSSQFAATARERRRSADRLRRRLLPKLTALATSTRSVSSR